MILRQGTAQHTDSLIVNRENGIIVQQTLKRSERPWDSAEKAVRRNRMRT